MPDDQPSNRSRITPDSTIPLGPNPSEGTANDPNAGAGAPQQAGSGQDFSDDLQQDPKSPDAGVPPADAGVDASPPAVR